MEIILKEYVINYPQFLSLFYSTNSQKGLYNHTINANKLVNLSTVKHGFEYIKFYLHVWQDAKVWLYYILLWIHTLLSVRKPWH